jgi:hypothetical protein
MMNDSILNIKVSCFENCTSTSPHDVNLLDWLTSEKHRSEIESLRKIQDENLQKTIKTSLPAITPSGLFSYRAEKDLIEHSGFLAFDIDKKDNLHIRNFDKLKDEISNIAVVAYCGLSVRGKGYWGLVPIPKSTSGEHRFRFSALSKFFREYGILLDESGKDICRLRICSWDPCGYFNHNAKLYTRILKPKPKVYSRPKFSDTRENVEAIISQIKENKIDITEDYKEKWLKIASALVNEFGESGRGYFHAVSMFHPKYSILDTDKMFDSCLKHNYDKVTIASFFKIVSDYGIKPNAIPVLITPVPFTNTTNLAQTIEAKGPPSKDTDVIHGLWDQDIAELEFFFKNIELPKGPFRLNDWTLINDVNFLIDSDFLFVKNHNGNPGYRPYLDNLKELRSLLSSN